jgi:hypothetical protein
MPEFDDFPTLADRLADELDEAFEAADANQELVEPTEDERRNGWTAETLSQYLAEQRAGQSLRIDPHSLQNRVAARSSEQNHRYNPHRWRG